MTNQVFSLNPELHKLETDSTKRAEYPACRSGGTSHQHVKFGIKVLIQSQWNQEFLSVSGLSEIEPSPCNRDVSFPFECYIGLRIEELLVKIAALHIHCTPIPRHPLSSWQIFLPSFAGSCPASWDLSEALPVLVQKSLRSHREQSSQAAAFTREWDPAKFSLFRQDTYSVCVKQTWSADRLKQA